MTRASPLSGDAATRALRDGIGFVRRQALVGWDGTQASDDRISTVRRRVAANWLGELDRLFGVWLDGGKGGRVAIRLEGRPGDPSNRRRDVERLLALKRTRETLRYTHGIVRRADRRGGDTMSLGWHETIGPHLVRLRLGERIELRARDLDDVCGFYERLAAFTSIEAP